jgi:sulfur-oxidizing protein SoxZ
MARALINVPKSVKSGEIFEIKSLISHPMETGFRVGFNGTLIPRDIIQSFTVTYNGTEIFRADLSSAIAANPFVSFFARATESGEIIFRWSGDNGFEAVETAPITVA